MSNITFTPTVAGTRNGSVTITDDAFDSPQTVSLTGLGQGPTALLNALSITFPNQGLEIASAAQIITLTNTGGGVLNISSILVSGDFARTTTCGATLISGANCTISVTFTPTAVGARIGSLVITSDVASSPNTINLSGTGGAVPVVSLDSMSLTFATENMGTSSAVKTVALTNTGGATLNLASIGASGDYTAQNNCGAGLVAGGSCSISITFTPTLVGARGGSITITSNAVGSPHTVSLSGIGTISLTLGQGWNLLGNGVDQVVSVSSLFGDPFAVTTVWKWDTTNLGWQFYAPSMDAPTLQTYATSKGYGVLSVINPGEGFWVNAKQAFAKPLPSGEAVIAVSFQEGQPGALKQGWNLISVGNSRTPSSFNGAMSAVVPAGGVIPINITTLWAWDNPLGRWYFYAPNLEAQGGSVLTDYITAKGYLDFTANSKILGPGVGFWVNKP